MQKTITVKGTGRVLAKPDYVVITMEIESQKMKYNDAMAEEAEKINSLTETLDDTGFEKDDLKTTNFNVRTAYRNVKDSRGDSKRVFDGYVVGHDLKLSFDFDTDRLSEVLTAISACPARPALHIEFTIKDAAAVNEEMLRSATVNARRKAEILCDAAGVELGDLIDINYSWGELDIYSRTKYEDEYECLAAPMIGASAVDFTPDDIDLSDTATFVWEIR